MGTSDLGRPLDKHVDNEELNALVPTRSETALELPGLSSQSLREAQDHVDSCGECSRKVRKYWLLANRSVANWAAAPPGVDCPVDVDWYEVAAGLFPELKATQLIQHAALCEHCGPLLRFAARLDAEPTPQEEKFCAQLKQPSRPHVTTVERVATWGFTKWLVPAMALFVLIGVLATRRTPSARPLSGREFAEFAVNTHLQHQQGTLALEIRSDSQQVLNEWFKTKAPFSLALPVFEPPPGEKAPYRLVGARMVQVAGKTAAFIAYQQQTVPSTAAGLPMSTVSLTVVPDSLAVASGGIEVDSNKLQFHYAMVKRHKVVTWSAHGLTYALVSQEASNSQQSCMVCHSGMNGRNLGRTPTALPPNDANHIEPVLQ